MIYLNNFIPIRVYYSKTLNLYRLQTCRADVDTVEFNEEFLKSKLPSFELQTTLYGLNPRLFPPVPLGTSMFTIYQKETAPFHSQKVEWIAFPIMTTLNIEVGDFSTFAFITNPGPEAVPVFFRNEENSLKITFDQQLIRDYFKNTPYDKKALDRDNFIVYLFQKPFLFWKGTTESICVPSNNPKDFSTLIKCQSNTYGSLRNHKSYTGNSAIPLSLIKENTFQKDKVNSPGKALFGITIFALILLLVLVFLKMWKEKKQVIIINKPEPTTL